MRSTPAGSPTWIQSHTSRAAAAAVNSSKSCSGRFHYDDETCGWQCLLVEYTYNKKSERTGDFPKSTKFGLSFFI